MRNWVRLGGTAVVLAFALSASAQDKKDEDKKPFSDEEFVKTAASAGLHESKLGEVGQLKGVNPQVKDFSRRMVIDHAAIANALREAAREANVTVPDKMLPKHEKDVEKFTNYKGDNFDADFMKHMVEDHEKAVDLFTQASKECKNAALKTYAERTLPILKAHLEMAKRINDTVKK